ncbi:MAG TPA: hypothetical protein VK947_11390 [Planococcus sp. (in: firmicutes)]|nr:hypothetical protein [Planococcus sp. (in: firmicutes)]
MNKTGNKVLLFSTDVTEDSKTGRKSIQQIVEEMKSKGINAEMCKRTFK